MEDDGQKIMMTLIKGNSFKEIKINDGGKGTFLPHPYKMEGKNGEHTRKERKATLLRTWSESISK